MTDIIDGRAVAEGIRSDLGECIQTLKDEGVTPGLATVLMSDDPASETYVSMKQRDCEEVGINGIHIEIHPDAPAEELYDTIDDLNEDPEVHGILVQMPVPDHVDSRQVLRAIDPTKDADGFHPENVGMPRRGTTPDSNPARRTGSRSSSIRRMSTRGEGRRHRRPVEHRRQTAGEPPDSEGRGRQRDGDGLSLPHRTTSPRRPAKRRHRRRGLSASPNSSTARCSRRRDSHRRRRQPRGRR